MCLLFPLRGERFPPCLSEPNQLTRVALLQLSPSQPFTQSRTASLWCEWSFGEATYAICEDDLTKTREL